MSCRACEEGGSRHADDCEHDGRKPVPDRGHKCGVCGESDRSVPKQPCYISDKFDYICKLCADEFRRWLV